MFVGSVPRPVVDQILRTVDFGPWRSVFVCCSGSFRVDRAIKASFPTCRVISNDVSLFSVALGRLLTGESVKVRFTGRLAFIERHIGGGTLDRMAAVMVALDMARYRGKNEWAQTHFAHYEAAFDEFLGRARVRLDAMLAGPRPDGFVAGDFRLMPALASKDGGGVVAFPPTYKGGYERLFRFIDENTDWRRPTYEIWDPEKLGAWVQSLHDDGLPFCVFSDHVLNAGGLRPVTSYCNDGRRTVYTYASGGGSSLRATRHRATPFQYEAVDPSALTPRTEVALVQADSAKMNFLKDRYLSKGIAHVSGGMNFLVFLDEKLAGAFIYQRSKFGDASTIYLLSDFAICRQRRISKLIALIATSCVPVSVFERRELVRVARIYTTAFTDKPVSMKYRGVFTLAARGDGMLNYESAVRNENPRDLYRRWYRKWAQNAGGRKEAARPEAA